MVARQSTATELCLQRLLELLHPPGSSYSAVIGGRVENIRALSNEAVHAYHREYYRPDNLCIIVTGQVNIMLGFNTSMAFIWSGSYDYGYEKQVKPKDIFVALDKTESRLMKRLPDPTPFIRPWFRQPLWSSQGEQEQTEPQTEIVYFPAEEGKVPAGLLLMGQ